MESLRPLHEISRSDLADLALPDAACITGVRQLSSYNWIEATSPTIAVPGCPPTWSHISNPRKLAKDSGYICIAQNQVRHPNSPLEPLFRSIFHSVPDFNIRAVDIVGDRNNFRQLLSFVDPCSEKYKTESFTISVEIVGDTALLKRHEAKVEEIIGPAEFRGYGHSFEKVYTHNEIKNSTGHYRIISYDFAGLNIVIRHVTDAFVAEKTSAQTDTSGEDLAGLISSLSVSTAKTVPTSSILTVTKEGRKVPREATLEIKTRSQRNPLKIPDVAAQMWISQTPKLVRAHHNGGVFGVPVVEDVAEEIHKWEKNQQASLKVLAALIRKIIDVAKSSSSGKATVRFDKVKDSLTIEESEDRKMLPHDLYRKWNVQPEPQPTENDKASGEPASPKVPAGTSADSSPNSGIMIGNETYENLPLSKMPTLASWVERERAKNTGIPKRDAVPLFPVVLAALNNGWRQCFRLLETGNVSQILMLCSTLDSLGVDALEGKSLEQVIVNVKAGKDDNAWDDAGRLNRSLARNAAFQLVYIMLDDKEKADSGSAKPDPARANKLYETTLYIAGHLRTFKYKTRSAVQAAYLHCHRPTEKQQAQLTKWSTARDASDDDKTSSDEPDSDAFNPHWDSYAFGSGSDSDAFGVDWGSD